MIKNVIDPRDHFLGSLFQIHVAVCLVQLLEIVVDTRCDKRQWYESIGREVNTYIFFIFTARLIHKVE